MRKHDYSKYLEAYNAGASSADLARQVGMNPGQMYRGLRAAGARMRGVSEATKGIKTMPSGKESASFKGGTFIDQSGYIRVRGMRGMPLQHRLIAERVIGRKLRAVEVVHHINGNKQDNRNENLLVCTNSYHRLIHTRMDAQAACGNPNWLRCRYCHTYDAPEHLSVKSFPYHRACAAAYQRDRKLRAAR